MATKRNYDEANLQETVHPSRQFLVPGSVPKPAKKARKFEPSEPKKQAHASSVNAIKKRIRDVARKLERSTDMPPTLRVESERAMADYQHELAAAEAEKIRQRMIKKYHMVRFFERQKATRTLKKLKKQLLEAKSTEEVEDLKVQMHVAEVDLNYAQFCPLAEVYISLYPPKRDGETEESAKEASLRPKPPMWAEVEKCLEEKTLNRLRNRAPTATVKAPQKTERKPAKPKPKPAPVPIDTTGLNRRERRRALGIAEPKKAKEETYGVKRTQSYAVSDETYKKAEVPDVDDEEDGGAFFTEG